MIVYKIDKHYQNKSAAQIRDMRAVLKDIPITLQLLQDAIQQQTYGISSPSIDEFRAELKETIASAIALTTDLSKDAQHLVAVSEQVAKHLVAVDEHFGAILRNRTPQTA